MKIKTSQFLIVAGGALLLAIIGYLFYQNSQLQQKLTSKEPPTAVPLNEVLETANWKTYTNSQGRYSLKYPNDWDVKAENAVVDSVTTKTILQSNDLTTRSINTPGIGGDQLTKGSKLEIFLSNNENFQSYEQLKDFMDNKSTRFPLNYFSSSEEIIVDGIKATVRRGGKTNELALGNTFCYFFKNGITYEFIFSDAENSDMLFDQMIQTFQFD